MNRLSLIWLSAASVLWALNVPDEVCVPISTPEENQFRNSIVIFSVLFSIVNLLLFKCRILYVDICGKRYDAIDFETFMGGIAISVAGIFIVPLFPDWRFQVNIFDYCDGMNIPYFIQFFIILVCSFALFTAIFIYFAKIIKKKSNTKGG